MLLFVNFTAQIIGLQYTSAGENAFLCSTYVVMTPFIVWIAKRVRPTGKEFLCAGIAIAGIALISLQGNMHFGIGQLITLGCPAAAAVIFVVTGHVAKEDNIYLLTWIQMLTVTVLSLLTASWFGAAPSHVSAGGIGAVLYMGVCYTGLAFICQNYGLAHASPEHTSIMLSLESVLGWMFGIILLH
ncbi:MAG: DMT family transporter, partial [Eubacterium sp.]|nr:DMT family transporter [Eubacterium sp.]